MNKSTITLEFEIVFIETASGQIAAQVDGTCIAMYKPVHAQDTGERVAFLLDNVNYQSEQSVRDEIVRRFAARLRRAAATMR